MSYESLYATLWGHSGAKPYDDVREAKVARARFGPAIPAIDEALHRATQAGRRLRVLDFGCADGHTAEQILGPFAASIDYYGCDVYPLDGTLERMVAAGFSTEVSSAGLADLPEHWPAFDVILALSCFQYIPQLDELFADLVARLASDGVLVVYFYDAGPLRQHTDAYFRHVLTDPSGAEDEARIERLGPLADLFAAIRDASDGLMVHVRSDVPELALPAGEIPLQKLLIDHILFAWAPPGASRLRIQWAAAELFLTGPHAYISADAAAALMAANDVLIREVISGPSGHLVIGIKH